MKTLHDYIRTLLAEAPTVPGTPQTAEDLVQQATGRVPDDAEKAAEQEALERDDEVAIDDPRFKGKAATFINRTGNTATVRDPETGQPSTVKFDKVMLVRNAADARKLQQQQQTLIKQNQHKSKTTQVPTAPKAAQAPRSQGAQGSQGAPQGQQAVGEAVLERMRHLAGIRRPD
jgi:hypothetical protein